MLQEVDGDVCHKRYRETCVTRGRRRRVLQEVDGDVCYKR